MILGAFVGHCRRKTVIISVSLAQVSEFSFVLSSRARRVGIISREVSGRGMGGRGMGVCWWGGES